MCWDSEPEIKTVALDGKFKHAFNINSSKSPEIQSIINAGAFFDRFLKTSDTFPKSVNG